MGNKTEEEIFKHRKKKDSDTSKSKKKSKHKHVYEPCLLKEGAQARYKYTYMDRDFLYGASYCIICGKIGHSLLGYDGVLTENGYWRSLTSEEMIEKYKKYPTFEANIFSNYVTLVTIQEDQERNNTLS